MMHLGLITGMEDNTLSKLAQTICLFKLGPKSLSAHLPNPIPGTIKTKCQDAVGYTSLQFLCKSQNCVGLNFTTDYRCHYLNV